MTVTEASHGILVLRRTACELEWGRDTARDDVQPARGETDDSEEETDTNTDGRGDRPGHQASEPLTKTKDGEEEEDDAFEEDGSEGLAIGDGTGSL